MYSAPQPFRISASLFAPLALLIPRRAVNPYAFPPLSGVVSGLSSPTQNFEISIYRARAIVHFLFYLAEAQRAKAGFVVEDQYSL